MTTLVVFEQLNIILAVFERFFIKSCLYDKFSCV